MPLDAASLSKSMDGPPRAARRRGRVPPREVTYFTTQLALMLEVGTSLADSLRALARQVTTPAFGDTLERVLRDVEHGMQLSDALARHPAVFDGVYCSMVRAGEAGGFLKDILERIAETQERSQALATQLKTAMAYPMVLCVVALGVVLFVLVGVLPRFTAFFEGKEALLPWTTRGLMALSVSLRTGWYYHLAGLAVAVAGGIAWVRSAWGQAARDRLAIGMPGIAGLCNKLYTCQMLRTMGLLMESRVPMLEALDVTRATISNRHYRDFIDRVQQTVRHGGKFSRVFSEYSYIIPSVQQMVATAEESGRLAFVMLRLAKFYDKEVEDDLKVKAALIEPLALIVLGGIVGVIVSAVILPLFKLAYVMR